MADERLRRLERQARSGAPHDRAPLISQRLRQGLLAEADVLAAATIGDLAARLVAGHPDCGMCEGRGSIPGETVNRPGEHVPCSYFPSFESWCQTLARHARPEVLQRTAAAVLVQALRTQAEDLDLVGEIVTWATTLDPADAHTMRDAADALADGWGRRGALALWLDTQPAGVISAVAHGISSEVAVRETVLEHVAPWLLGEGPFGLGT
jgi:hypothetical protein